MVNVFCVRRVCSELFTTDVHSVSHKKSHPHTRRHTDSRHQELTAQSPDKHTRTLSGEIHLLCSTTWITECRLVSLGFFAFGDLQRDFFGLVCEEAILSHNDTHITYWCSYGYQRYSYAICKSNTTGREL